MREVKDKARKKNTMQEMRTRHDKTRQDKTRPLTRIYKKARASRL